MASHTGRILHRNAVAGELTGARAGLLAAPFTEQGDLSQTAADEAHHDDDAVNWLFADLDAAHGTAYLAAFTSATEGIPSHCTIPSPVRHGRWLRVAVSPSAASTVVIVIEDTTDLAEAERNLRSSNRLLQALDSHSEELVLVFDPDGTQRYISSSIERILGHFSAPSSADEVFAFIHPDDASVVHRRLPTRASPALPIRDDRGAGRHAPDRRNRPLASGNSDQPARRS